MNIIKRLLPLSFFFILLISCNRTKVDKDLINNVTTPTTEVEEEVEKEVPPIVFQNSFLTVVPGTPIVEYKAIIEEDLLQTGEGDFEIYNIKNAQQKVLAYFLADPVDNELVGDIYITSPLAQTEDDIHIGQTFGDLVTKYSTLEVHGSEIESQTFATVGNLSFRIDEAHATYELEISAVSKTAKIIEIVIKR